jgi:hypothetical protein
VFVAESMDLVVAPISDYQVSERFETNGSKNECDWQPATGIRFDAGDLKQIQAPIIYALSR